MTSETGQGGRGLCEHSPVQVSVPLLLFFSEAGSHVAHTALKLAVDNLELLTLKRLHSRVLGLQACTTTPQLFFFLLKKGVIN